MKKITIASLITIASFTSFAQINVFSGNNVGIGPGLTSSASSLSINTTGANYVTMSLAPMNTAVSRGIMITNNTATTQYFVGLSSIFSNANNITSQLRGVLGSVYNATPQAAGQAFGVVGTAGNFTKGYNFGVYGNLLGSNNGTAIYGQVGTTQAEPDAQYAGYFVGDVKVVGKLFTSSGTITSSDKKLKKNISVLDSSDRIFNLQPKKYNLKSRKELIADGTIKMPVSDTTKTTTVVDDNNTQDIIKKQHFGFLAQDIQKVFPDLVYTSGDGTLGVDYQGFIPIIVAQLQAMKQQNDAKDARIAALEAAIAKLNKKQ